MQDPFNLEETQETLNQLIKGKGGASVLILRQKCALSPERKAKKYAFRSVDGAVVWEKNAVATGCARGFSDVPV